MRTDELVGMLARSEPAVQPVAPGGRFALALGWGAFGATLLMAVMLGVRPDLWEAMQRPMFWVKLAFVAVLAWGSLRCALRLSRPGMVLGLAPVAVAAPIAAMALLAALVLMHAQPADRVPLLLGRTWATCPFNIALLSLPAFGMGMWAMKGLAPTRPRLAGAAVGLLAGAIAALVYALHCPESTAPFLAVWYVLGMAIPAAAGALAGARLLRW
jgi:hypothetical protein